MRVAITGATGFVGRNLLFEIVRQHLTQLDSLEILVLGRAATAAELFDRVRGMFWEDGFEYVDPPSWLHLDRALSRAIRCIPCDLSQRRLDISPGDIAAMARAPIDHVIHAASLTDLSTRKLPGSAVETVNVTGTERLLELLQGCDVGTLSYISTAYACGKVSGAIAPDHANPSGPFRNAYEESKLVSEFLIHEFAERTGVAHKIFRPSIVCGRLLERPTGAVSKFEGMYGWATFFAHEKMKRVGPLERWFEVPVDLPVRLHLRAESGLDIVPVDYVAKIVWGALLTNDPGQHFHVARGREVAHVDYLTWILESLDVVGYQFVAEEPRDKSALEHAYYRGIGRVYTPYGVAEPMLFRTEAQARVEGKVGLTFPPLDRHAFTALMDFARRRDFGLRPRHRADRSRAGCSTQGVAPGELAVA